jgi:hypothetical protein
MAMLGVYPLSQVAVQLSPSAIWLTPAPQYPVDAALAIPVASTGHAVESGKQAKVSKVPAEHATWALLARKFAAQVTVH